MQIGKMSTLTPMTKLVFFKDSYNMNIINPYRYTAPASNMLSDTWATTGGVTYSAGVIYFDFTNGYADQEEADMNDPVVVSTDYNISFDISVTTGGALYFRMISYTGETYVNYAEYGNGNHSIDFTSPSDIGSGGFSFGFHTDGDSSGTLTNYMLTER